MHLFNTPNVDRNLQIWAVWCGQQPEGWKWKHTLFPLHMYAFTEQCQWFILNQRDESESTHFSLSTCMHSLNSVSGLSWTRGLKVKAHTLPSPHICIHWTVSVVYLTSNTQNFISNMMHWAISGVKVHTSDNLTWQKLLCLPITVMDKKY